MAAHDDPSLDLMNVYHGAPIDTNLSKDAYLDTLNDDFANSIWPAIVFVGVLMVVGLVGNVYVLYVYSKKNCHRTIIRFIQVLAVFDLLSCAIAMPGEILDMTLNYTFGDSALCPGFRTINLFCTMASGSTLVVVAVDRYRRICNPHQNQIKPKVAGFILLGLSLICLVLSLPSTVVFGRKEVATPVPYINGSDCSISDSMADTPVPLLFNGFQMLLFLIGAIVLVVFYSFIARAICLQARKRKKRAKNRRLSLKNGLLSSSAYTRPDVSSPSSPSNVKSRNVFKYPEAVSDNILDLSDVTPTVTESPCSRMSPETEATQTRISGDRATIANGNSMDKKKGLITLTVPDCKQTVGGHLLFLRSISATSSTTSGFDTETPPETPIDMQRLDTVALLRQHRGPTVGLTAPQSNHHHRHSYERGIDLPPSIEECPRDSEMDENANTNKQSVNVTNLKIRDFPLGDKTTSENINNNNTSEEDKLREERFKDEDMKCNQKDVFHIGESEYTQNVPNNKDGDASSNGVGHNGVIPLRRKSPSSDTCSQPGGSRFNRFKGNRMSLIIPAVPRKVVFRSSSLGKEDIRRHHKPRYSDRSLTPSELGKDLRETTSRLRRLSSVRGFRDLKRLTATEYQGTVRTTFMLFLITVTYVLSFLPHLILMTLKVTGDEGSSSWEVARNIFVRSYFINSVANPIIYSFCSRNFFSQCRNPQRQTGTLTR